VICGEIQAFSLNGGTTEEEDGTMLRIEGKIYTGLLEPETTDSLLVGESGVILATGEEARRPLGTGVREIVLGKRVATAGFIDAHVHLENLARELTCLALADARSLDDVLARVAALAKTFPRDRVIFGTSWDESTWPEPAIPTREILDRSAPNHAVTLRRVCGHLWTVNSEALRRIASRDDLTRRERERVEAVRRDGVLREGDIALARPLTTPTRDELLDGLSKAVRHAVSLGATCVHDVGDVAGPLMELDRRGELPLRVVAGRRCDTLDEDLAGVLRETPRGEMIYPGPIKVFVDGAIGSQTAAISEDFADDRGNRGVLLWEDATLEEFVARAHGSALQLALHAIGDRAIRQAIEVFERVLGRQARPDHRHRIEHAEMITGELTRRLAKLAVIASVQPNFVGRWQQPGGLYERRLGRRARRLNPFRSMLRAHVVLAFGSDGMPLDPLYGLVSAMNHPASGERLGFVEALHAYTFVSAFAGRIEHVTGSLEAGKQADVVILSGDPAERTDVRVEEVYVAGRRRFPF
jgi:hypothetical protein